MIATNNGHVLAFDNLSGLPHWLSAALCRLASGGSFAVRRLYTDDEEVLFKAARPIVLNGIDDVIGRADLADRAIFLSLTPIRFAGLQAGAVSHSGDSTPTMKRCCLRRPAPSCLMGLRTSLAGQIWQTARFF